MCMYLHKLLLILLGKKIQNTLTVVSIINLGGSELPGRGLLTPSAFPALIMTVVTQVMYKVDNLIFETSYKE